MAFLKVVEVFPPSFPVHAAGEAPINTEERLERFVEEVRSMQKLADIILVADVKDPRLLKVSSIEAATILRRRLGVNAAPVLVVRDSNRLRFLSCVLTTISLELETMTIVWGDAYPPTARSSNVRDFPSLTDAIAEASTIRRRSRASTLFLAPVDMEGLAQPRGVALARGRLKAGADYLLAQPPTTDAQETFDRHAGLLRSLGLKESVLLNLFPFRDKEDVEQCEKYFGWKLPASLRRAASEGKNSLQTREREVVQRLRDENFPGIYLNTRGEPGVAERLLS
jgi:5,10-methylenetetrahydrofolate reductase